MAKATTLNPAIDPQLLQDCHHLGRLSAGELLLHRNALLPWFILVPDTDLEDYLDMAAPELEAVLADCRLISGFIKRDLGYSKVNFAGLGNVVPQMHLHVIGRSADDPCWPAPVWGNLGESRPYDDATLVDWQQRLEQACGLCVRA